LETLHIRFLRYSAFYSPLLLTMSGGHLAAEGLTATFDIAGPDRPIPSAIASGEVQVAQSAPAVSFAPWERGEELPFRHFALLNSRDGFFLAGRGAGPLDWKSLEGRTAVIDHFFQPLAMFRQALANWGVDPAKVTLIDAGDVAAIEKAYRAGQGDVVHMQGPTPQQFQHEGLGTVFASVGEAVGPVAFSSLCASPAWLATDQARAFSRAFRNALVQARTAPAEELAALVAGFFPAIDRAPLVTAIAAYQAMGTWDHDATITPDLYERAVDLFLGSGDITVRPAFADIVESLPC
jgi:NitT/TauT family transport system substrate-binding protein